MMDHIARYVPKDRQPWGPDDVPEGVCPECWEVHRCNGCHDGGFVRYAVPKTDRNFGKAWPCPNCIGASHVDAGPPENPDERMRIPMAYRDAAVGKLNAEQRASIADIISGKPQATCVTMSGGTGAGKTYASVCALKAHLLTTGHRGAFWPVIDLLERYRATFDHDRATETTGQIDEQLRKTSMLVLDDWGKQKDTEWADQQLFRLLDERLRNMQLTIVTANTKPEDFPDALRSRLFGRLAKVVAFTGRDRRQS